MDVISLYATAELHHPTRCIGYKRQQAHIAPFLFIYLFLSLFFTVGMFQATQVACGGMGGNGTPTCTFIIRTDSQ